MADANEKHKSVFWICLDCVRREGWPTFGWEAPKVVGLCGWCNDPATKPLMPMRKFLGEPRKFFQ